MFPNKNWRLGGLKALIKKIDTTGTVVRRMGSGQPRTVRIVCYVEGCKQAESGNTYVYVYLLRYLKLCLK